MLALARIDWATISSLATAAGTLVLAIATFAAVRSASRSTKIAELALHEQRRPVFVPSRLEDPLQKLNFADGVWVEATGGHAAAQEIDGRVYLAISLRNVGAGIGVCQSWSVQAGLRLSGQNPTHMPLEGFRLQTRDLYVPGGDIGMWQAALRNAEDPARASVGNAIRERSPITVELLYSDLAGFQRTVTRFALIPVNAGGWHTSMSRHWFLDRDGPRPDGAELTQVRQSLTADIEASGAVAVPRGEDRTGQAPEDPPPA